MTSAVTEILQSLELAGDRTIVQYRDRRFSGRDIISRVQARIADLQRSDLSSGKNVLILVHDNLSAMEQLLACWCLGLAVCFVDFRTTPERIVEWRRRLQPSLIIGLRPFPGIDIHLQSSDPAPINCDPFDHPADFNLCAIWTASSGATGMPKLHSITQSGLDRMLRNLVNTTEDWGVWSQDGGPDAMLSATSVSYSASAFQWLRNLRAGRPIVALDLVHSLAELDSALSLPEVTECALPPTLIRRLSQLPAKTLPRYPHIRRLTSVGGPALPQDKLAAIAGLTSNYVMTYSCVGIGLISRITGTEVVVRPASCGRPLPPVTVEIRDGERLCNPNEIGEIVVSTEHVEDVRPGDLGWRDEEGYLYVTGRVQGRLCRNGVNFSADRLTVAALTLPSVTEACVVALSDQDAGDQIHLIVQAPPEMAVALHEKLRETLPVAEQPNRIHFRSDFALTAGGKVDARHMHDWLMEQLNDAQS